DASLLRNGLAGLACLLASRAKDAALILQMSAVPLSAVLNALARPVPGPEGRESQGHAAECLLLAASDSRTRQRWIEGGGIDVILNALSNTERGIRRELVDAKLVAVLAIMAAHNKDVRDEIFDRVDFMMELRFAVDVAGERARAAQTHEQQRQARRLCAGLYESFAVLAIHGEFKERLIASKKTLGALQALAKEEDLGEDPAVGFHFASLVHNLCRSREDRVRIKTGNPMIDELSGEDFKALEEFYERMPAEARPTRSGEVDPGAPQLAQRFRTWCLERGEAGGAALLVAKLCRCVSGSMQTKALIADSLKLLCSDQQERKIVAASGGVRTLLALSNLDQESRDPGRKDAEEGARNAARQALAQILIVMNPQLLQYQEQLDAVRPMLALLEHRHELLQFEGCLALTNLLSASEELRSFALQSGAWSKCKDLLFSENEEVQRAGLEAMCNLTMAEEVAERFALGKAENELKIFGAFCASEIERQQIAATGALAILSGLDEVAVRIADCEQCLEGLLRAALESDIPAVELRAVSALVSLRRAEGVNQEVRRAIFAASSLRTRRAPLRRKCSRAAELLQPLVPVAMKKLCKALRDCVRASAFSIFERGKGWQQGYWRMVMVRQSTAEELLVMVQTAKLEDAQREALAAEVIAALTKAELQINVVSIYLQFNDEISDAARPGAPLMHIHGDAQLRMQLLGLSFNIGPLSFYQANSTTCALLYERALEWLKPQNDVAVLDVCCGVGTIGLCASRRCRRVIGIELIPEAVEAAKANAELNKVENTEWIAGAPLVGWRCG
ncbi:TRMT2A, partial [Symbiodinium sp. CCMP2456]